MHDKHILLKPMSLLRCHPRVNYILHVVVVRLRKLIVTSLIHLFEIVINLLWRNHHMILVI